MFRAKAKTFCAGGLFLRLSGPGVMMTCLGRHRPVPRRRSRVRQHDILSLSAQVWRAVDTTRREKTSSASIAFPECALLPF